MEAALKDAVAKLNAVTARLEAVEAKLGSGCGSGSGSSGAAAPVSGAAYVTEFNNLIADNIPNLKDAAEKIGNDNLKAQVAAFVAAVEAHKNFLNIAAQCKKPSDAVLGELLKPTSEKVTEVISIRDGARGDKMWEHLSTLSEFVPALGWVTVEPTPGPFVKEFHGNGQFYSNKLIRLHKGKDADQMKFVESVNGFGKGLQDYIKKFHTTGLSWNKNGGDASAFKGAAAPAAAATKAAPKAAASKPSFAPKKGGAMGNALFAELSKGGAVTSGLKKVDKSQMTHKNTALRAGSKVAGKPSTSKSVIKKGTPKFQLDGNKWLIDFQDGNKDIVIENPEVKHTVYVYKCENSVIQVKGKVNAITLDGCRKCGIVFENCVASVELVNCNSCEVQAIGKVPNFTVDKCSSIQLILSKECLDAEIITAKSDQMNVVLPGATPNDDIIEVNIPEQFKTVISGNKLITNHVEHV